MAPRWGAISARTQPSSTEDGLTYRLEAIFVASRAPGEAQPRSCNRVGSFGVSSVGRLWADVGPMLGRFWARVGPVVGRLWADFGRFYFGDVSFVRSTFGFQRRGILAPIGAMPHTLWELFTWKLGRGMCPCRLAHGGIRMKSVIFSTPKPIANPFPKDI